MFLYLIKKSVKSVVTLYRGEAMLTTVFFGANDAALQPVSIQHVPLEEYKANIKSLVEKLLKRSSNVLIITPPPVDTKKWAVFCEQKGYKLNRSEEVGCRYLDYVETHEEHGSKRPCMPKYAKRLRMSSRCQCWTYTVSCLNRPTTRTFCLMASTFLPRVRSLSIKSC